MRYLFGEHSFDTGTRELRRGSTLVRLAPKPHALLEALLAEHPRVVPHGELHQRLWPNVHVTDASLARVVSELRSALGESGEDARLIRTTHRVGYSVGVPVRRDEGSGADSDSECVLFLGRRRIALHDGVNLLGRDESSVVVLDDPMVSRRHCRIVVEEGRAWVEDLQSKNGTFLRGARLVERGELEPGDVLGIGSARLVFGVTDSQASTATEAGAGAEVVVGRFSKRTGSRSR
jgi:DNA-binding winged helix-turn-helix (wHTH) protein